MKISVIIPVYNEEETVEDCLKTIIDQTYASYEVIVVDDGSTDNSIRIVENLKSKISNLKFYTQKHTGPGIARNLGAKQAKGDILVFVDADMTFHREFLEKLTKPIRNKQAKGTFTIDEFVGNWDNVWARSWNTNQNLPAKRRIPANHPNTASVFRAIERSEFEKAEGFDAIGYTDDWTLARKLGYKATIAPNAVSYHRNPETLSAVFAQARWIGKNEFLTRNVARKLLNLARYSLPVSLIIGATKALRFVNPYFIVFKVVYDFGVFVSIFGSFLGEHTAK